MLYLNIGPSSLLWWRGYTLQVNIMMILRVQQSKSCSLLMQFSSGWTWIRSDSNLMFRHDVRVRKTICKTGRFVWNMFNQPLVTSSVAGLKTPDSTYYWRNMFFFPVICAEINDLISSMKLMVFAVCWSIRLRQTWRFPQSWSCRGVSALRPTFSLQTSKVAFLYFYIFFIFAVVHLEKKHQKRKIGRSKWEHRLISWFHCCHLHHKHHHHHRACLCVFTEQQLRARRPREPSADAEYWSQPIAVFNHWGLFVLQLLHRPWAFQRALADWNQKFCVWSAASSQWDAGKHGQRDGSIRGSSPQASGEKEINLARRFFNCVLRFEKQECNFSTWGRL